MLSEEPIWLFTYDANRAALLCTSCIKGAFCKMLILNLRMSNCQKCDYSTIWESGQVSEFDNLGMKLNKQLCYILHLHFLEHHERWWERGKTKNKGLIEMAILMLSCLKTGWDRAFAVRSPMIPERDTPAAHCFPKGWVKWEISHTHTLRL